jgi:hypothetical protein
VDIYTNSAGKIEKVEDKWDGNLPDSSITKLGPLRGGVGVLGVELEVGDACVAGALNLI